MKRSIPLYLLAGLLLLLAMGCSNPADDAPDAQVSEPTAEPEPMAATEATVYALSEDSSIGFVGSKVTGSHDGGFKSFEGEISVGDTPESANVKVMIDTTSLWADNEKLTGHLKSDDFFGVETHPTATFESTAIAAGDDGAYTLTGNLDLHGVTKQISFPATIAMTDLGFHATAEFSINRMDFGIEYPGATDDLIREDVLIKLDLRSAATGGMEKMDAEEEPSAG